MHDPRGDSQGRQPYEPMTFADRMNSQLTESNMKEIFKGLVESQDAGESVEDSRDNLAQRFEVTLEDILVIEKLGIAHRWPPLASGS